MARCLVTGASGGIGSHLCERLSADGHEVFKLDLKIASYHDIRYRYNVFTAFDSFKPEWVFHLAALADIVPSIENPAHYHQTNVDGTVNVLEYARAFGVKRFIYAASSSCYGKNPPIPTDEKAPIDPAYPYALTKWIGEQYVLHYSKVYGLPTISLRLFNVFGPGFRTTGTYGAVFGVFLSQLANNAPFTIVGDGTQRRDFTFVSDVCEAFIKAAESDISGEVFNVGTGEPQSINYLAELLQPRAAVYIPDRPGEPRTTWADCREIEERLGWTPKVSFEQGVGIMLDNVGAYRSAPLWTPDKIEDATKQWFRRLS